MFQIFALMLADIFEIVSESLVALLAAVLVVLTILLLLSPQSVFAAMPL